MTLHRTSSPISTSLLSRAVEIGASRNLVMISAQMPPVVNPSVDPQSLEAFGDTRQQTLGCLGRVAGVLQELQLTLEDLVGARVYLVADPRIAEDSLRQAFENAGRRAIHGLERYLNTLGTIAAAAPLLGLFGTVVGMIEIFGSQAPTGASGSNPAQLAHGISIALYNTAFGLIIAIPSLIFWRYFRGQVDAYLMTLELSADRLARHLKSMRK